MYNILTLNKISAAGLDHFDTTKYNYGEEMANPDAIMVRSAKMHDMELPESTLAIARAGAGTFSLVRFRSVPGTAREIGGMARMRATSRMRI